MISRYNCHSNEELFYQKNIAEELNFIECLQLLETLINNKMLALDSNNENNVIVYWSGDEINPEGWYTKNLHDVASELLHDEEGQLYLKQELA
jgi:hypothetical protein